MPERSATGRRPVATSCSRSRPGCSPSGASRNTTVRDIADAAGILSGSLYHHFDSKESMVDEILRHLPGASCSARYDEIVASDREPAREARGGRARLVRGDRPAPQRGGDLPERRRLPRRLRAVRLPRRAQRAVPSGCGAACCTTASSAGELRARPRRRPRLPLPARHRLGRASPGTGPAARSSADQVADQYLSILLDGIAR